MRGKPPDPVSATQLLNQISTAVVGIDFDERVRFWNRGAERLYWRTADETLGTPLSENYRYEFIGETSQATVMSQLGSQGSWSGENLHILPDGRELLVESDVSMWRNEDGEQIGYLAVIRDVTAKRQREVDQLRAAKRAQEEARIHWDKLTSSSLVVESFLDHLPAYAFVKDDQGRYLFCNRAFRKIAPGGASASVGRTDESLFSPEEARLYREHDELVLRTGEPLRTIERSYVDQEERTFLAVRFPLSDNEGKQSVAGVWIDISDKIRLTDDLRVRSALLDVSNDAIYLVDMNGYIQYWNAGAERLYGWTRQEAQGKSASELLNTQLPIPLPEALDALLSEGFWEGEVTQRNRVGEPIPILCRWSIWKDASGAPKGRMVISADITGRKLAEQELHEKRGQLRRLLDSLQQIVWISSTTGTNQYLNEFALEYHGIREADAVGFDWSSRIHPEDLGATESKWMSALERGEPCEIEQRILRAADGAYRWHLVRTVPIQGADGHVREWLGYAVDIHDLRTAKAAAEAREAQLGMAMRSAQMGAWELDCATNLLRWSFAHFALFGITPEQFDGRLETAFRNLHPEDRDRIWQELQAALAHKQTAIDQEFRVIWPDGSVHWIISRATIEYSPAAEAIRVVGFNWDFTDRKAIETRLHEREMEAKARAEELSAILDAVPALTFIAHDSACERMTGSREAYKLLGIPMGSNPSLSVAESERPSHFRVFEGEVELTPESMPVQRAASSGQDVRNCEINLKFNDGTSRDLFGNAVPLFDEQGNSRGAVGAFIDITERNRAEAELRGSEVLYRNTFEIAPVGIAHVDPVDGKWLRFNDAVCSITGYSRPELETMRFSDITHPDDLESDWQRARQLLVGKVAQYDMEKRYVRKDGSLVWVHLTVSLVKHDDGSPKHFVSIIEDISERKRAQAALDESDSKFRMSVETVPQAFAMFSSVRDSEGKIVDFHVEYANAAGLADIGLQADEYIGRNVCEVLPAHRQSGLLEQYIQAVETDTPFHTKAFRFCDEFGGQLSERWYEVHASKWQDGLVVAWQNITEQKRSEEALRRAEKLAVAGRLALSISHEINNPLEAVTNILYLIGLDQTLQQETRSHVEMGLRELQRVSHLVTQTLRYGKSSSQLTETDLREIADSALSLFQSRILAAGIEVEREYRTDQMVKGYPHELRQVIANLVSNAYESMKSGGKMRIRISKARSWSKPDIVGLRVTVADTGAGIPENVRHRLFEPFFTTKFETGTGLGLWVCSEVVGRHRGQISFRSSTAPGGRGTVFSIFLPVD